MGCRCNMINMETETDVKYLGSDFLGECGVKGNYAWYHITPWVRELTVSFKCLNALYIRDMKVDDSELELLARTRGKDLRVLEIEDYRQRVDIFGNCLLELALHNKVIESLEFTIGFGCYDWEDRYDGNDLTLLAKNCSKSLVSLKISPCRLSKLGKAFRHAVRLEDFDGAYFDKDDEALEFPPNMRCLGIYNMPVTSYPLVLPLVNQLRELNLQSYPFKRECQCFLIERCPNLEVLHTEDIVGICPYHK
ncbi:leucine-rich repeat, cysteine-containing subtype protein [Tanacetum coccineum]